MKRKKLKSLQKKKIKEDKKIEMDSLLFVYNTTIEKQQFPIPAYPASCPVSPEYGMEVKRSLSHLELTSFFA